MMLKNFMLKQEKMKTLKNSQSPIKNNKKLEKYDHSSRPIRNFITIEDLKINWKPDVILIGLDLMNKHLSKGEKYRMDD